MILTGQKYAVYTFAFEKKSCSFAQLIAQYNKSNQ